MGWGTDFKADIFLNRIVINNDSELDDLIRETEYDLNEIKTRLNMYVASNPKDITPDEWKEESLRFLHTNVNELIDELQEKTVLQYNLGLYKQYLEDKKE